MKRKYLKKIGFFLVLGMIPLRLSSVSAEPIDGYHVLSQADWPTREACLDAYQLCRKPHEAAIYCFAFDKQCSGFWDIVIAEYTNKKAKALHQKDCEAKQNLCQAGNPDSCRPYWTYCQDFDQKQRKHRRHKGEKALPSLAEKPLSTETETFLPCDKAGKIFLFNDKMAFLQAAKVSENHAIELKEAQKDLWQKVGRLNDGGEITPDKSLKGKNLSILKAASIIGQLQENGDILRCGTKHSARRLGFYAKTGNKQTILLDRLNEQSPISLGTVEGNF